MYEKDSDMSFGPLTIEIEDAPGGTVWTIRLTTKPISRFRFPNNALQEAMDLMLKKAEMYEPANLNTLLQVHGHIRRYDMKLLPANTC